MAIHMKTELDIYQVDAFAREAFKGNPAGVCITEKPLDERLMQLIAAEMAVSETAFLSLETMNLRWFTPRAEVALCGHGTLATAHIMQQQGLLKAGKEIAFDTLSGELKVKLTANKIEMDFPQSPIDFSVNIDANKLAHLGIKPEEVLCSGQFQQKDFIEITSEEALLALSPNFDALATLTGRGVVVTARSDSPIYDFISRYFAPWVGVNEDPVTGSTHCALAGYWGSKLEKDYLAGYQASARGGRIEMALLPYQRVKLIGTAVTTLKGQLLI
ncbi:PhzF family phenazine biosynthesis protein [Vibrio vulnificus]|nr:PhzF family phenazine biosynthesis protein [Vibrio vulnificus]EGQ9309805.1 PhzF family phenazine biosynthesis protein [Vibrio vulnificus]EHD0093497.1 PhzF family phenazine biosynthesis protein [Vibrio vulnificus]EHH0684576.1 PhzF family phenazine biosynthesis protein [Vibrio vulnificus]HAS8103274.1 PhzF family phenazine biosynthesis isomerase [Vibrio vulnificus]